MAFWQNLINHRHGRGSLFPSLRPLASLSLTHSEVHTLPKTHTEKNKTAVIRNRKAETTGRSIIKKTQPHQSYLSIDRLLSPTYRPGVEDGRATFTFNCGATHSLVIMLIGPSHRGGKDIQVERVSGTEKPLVLVNDTSTLHDTVDSSKHNIHTRRARKNTLLTHSCRSYGTYSTRALTRRSVLFCRCRHLLGLVFGGAEGGANGKAHTPAQRVSKATQNPQRKGANQEGMPGRRTK